MEELEDADKVAGVADVHRVGEGRDGRFGVIVAGAQIGGDDVVGIAGGDEVTDGEAGAVGEEAGADIAEVAAGYADHRRSGFVGPLLGRKEIIELLGEPAGDVDGVRRGEEEGFCECGVGEGFFDHALAIVETSFYFEGGDVLSEGGELEFLDAAYFPGGVEDDNAYTFYIIETAGDGAAGVAGGRDEYGDGAGVILSEVSEAAAHEAGADVFECEGGTVEELE